MFNFAGLDGRHLLGGSLNTANRKKSMILDLSRSTLLAAWSPGEWRCTVLRYVDIVLLDTSLDGIKH